jgi:hypothetical protein
MHNVPSSPSQFKINKQKFKALEGGGKGHKEINAA